MKRMFISIAIIIALCSCGEVENSPINLEKQSFKQFDSIVLDTIDININLANQCMLKYNELYKNSKSIFVYDAKLNSLKNNLFYNSKNELISFKADSAGTSSYFILRDKMNKRDFHVIEKKITQDSLIYYVTDNFSAGFGIYTMSNDFFVFYNVSPYDSFTEPITGLGGDVLISDSQFSTIFLINYKHSLYRNIWKIDNINNRKYSYVKLASQYLDLKEARTINPSGNRSLEKALRKIRVCDKNLTSVKGKTFESPTKLDLVFYNPLLYVWLLRNDEEKNNKALCR